MLVVLVVTAIQAMELLVHPVVVAVDVVLVRLELQVKEIMVQPVLILDHHIS